MRLLTEHPEQWIQNNKGLGRAYHTSIAAILGTTIVGGITVGGSLAAAGTVAAAATAGMGLYQSMQGGKGGKAGSMNIPYTNVPQVNYNPEQGSADLLKMYPNLERFAQADTDYKTRNRETIMPGAANQFKLASGVLQDWMQGQVPQDVVDFTNRTVAQRSGGGFNPFTGGGNTQQDFARSIGKLSSDFTQMGVSAAPQWEQLANSFITTPLQVAPMALAASDIRYKYDALNSGVNLSNTENQYRAQQNSQMFDANQSNLQNAQNMQMINTGINGVTAAAKLGQGYRSPSNNWSNGYAGNTAYPSQLTPTQLNQLPSMSDRSIPMTGNPFAQGA